MAKQTAQYIYMLYNNKRVLLCSAGRREGADQPYLQASRESPSMQDFPLSIVWRGREHLAWSTYSPVCV